MKLNTSQPGMYGVKRKRVSKWSDEQQEIFLSSGILEINRVSDITKLLPSSITDCCNERQIRTRLVYEKSK